MADALVDGRGSGNYAGIDETNRLMVVGSITDMPTISVGSLSVSAGSTAYMFGASGTGYNEILSSTEGWLYTRSFEPLVDTGSVGAIVANNETLIVEHVITAGSIYYLTGFDATASADSRFKLLNNAILQTALKINPAERNIQKAYNFPLRFLTGSIVLTGKHQDSESQGFEATLYGVEMEA